LALFLSLAMPSSPASPPREAMAVVPAGVHRSPFLSEGKPAVTRVKAFRLDKRPVTVAEYLAFVRAHPPWKRSQVKRIFADSAYLSDWPAEDQAPSGSEHRAVTYVSWFAAKAYCSFQGKRLPATAEWERSVLQPPSGIDSSAYAARILEWYSRPSGAEATPGRLKAARHAFGLEDLAGTVWEWTSDFNAAGPADRGEGSARDASFFCGGAAGAAVPGTDYATFMRYAFRSSLKPNFNLSTLGFRCAQDL
jgi:formylglycine-generating enzyme required for sulfatase activity